MKRPLLLVEDDPEIRGLLVDLLSDEGYPVTAAANGREALDALAAAPEPPALALIDRMMPVMDGLQLRAQMQGQSRFAAIPTVLLSASADLAGQAAAAGFVEFMRKPIDLSSLLALVARYCGA